MNYTILVNEIVSDQLGRGYAGMSDSEVVASLNAKDRARLTPITSAELLAWSGGGADDSQGIASRYERIEQAATNHASGAIRGACKAAIRLIERDGTLLDLSLPDRAAMVDALVVGGVLTPEEKGELLELGAEPCSRAEELGIERVTEGHVISARQM